MVRAAENEILDTSGYLLNVKFINCLLCFSTKDERRRLKERARNGLMRGFWKNFRFRDIYVRFKEVSQNLNILAFVRLFNEFLFGLNRRQKISPFLKAIHRVFLLFEATLRRTQLSIPACAQLCEISLFRKFFKLLYVSDQPFFFFATVNFSSPPPNLVTKITSTIFSLVFPKISPPQFKNTPNENSNIINYPTLYVSLERKDFWPNFLLSKGSKSIPIAIYEIDAISIEFLLIGATDPITIPLRFFFKPVPIKFKPVPLIPFKRNPRGTGSPRCTPIPRVTRSPPLPPITRNISARDTTLHNW